MDSPRIDNSGSLPRSKPDSISDVHLTSEFAPALLTPDSAFVKLGKFLQVFCASSPESVQLISGKSPLPVANRLSRRVHSGLASQAEKILHRHDEQAGWRGVAGPNHVPGHGVTRYPKITAEEILEPVQIVC